MLEPRGKTSLARESEAPSDFNTGPTRDSMKASLAYSGSLLKKKKKKDVGMDSYEWRYDTPHTTPSGRKKKS